MGAQWLVVIFIHESCQDHLLLSSLCCANWKQGHVIINQIDGLDIEHCRTPALGFYAFVFFCQGGCIKSFRATQVKKLFSLEKTEIKQNQMVIQTMFCSCQTKILLDKCARYKPMCCDFQRKNIVIILVRLHDSDTDYKSNMDTNIGKMK